MILSSAGARHQADVTEVAGSSRVVIDGVAFTVRAAPERPAVFRVAIGDQTETLHCVADGPTIHLFWRGRAYRLRREASAAVRADVQGAIETPMPGRIIAVRVATGDVVRQGQELAIVEAMKMETVVRAPRDGRVQTVRVAAGDRVGAGAILLEIE